MIIGITGHARSGKDTLSDYLSNKLCWPKYSFAKPIKDMLRVGLGLSFEHLEGDLKESIISDIGKSPRHMMQTLGTEWGRELINDNLWMLLAKRYYEKNNNIIISDVRFNNEAKWIRSTKKGIVVHITRKNAPEIISHTSENGVKKYLQDHWVKNDGPLEDLMTWADEFIDLVVYDRV